MNELGVAEVHITIEVAPGNIFHIHPTDKYGLNAIEPGEVQVECMVRYREVPPMFQDLFTQEEFTDPRDSVWVRYIYLEDMGQELIPIFYLPAKAFIGCTTHI